MLTARTRLEGVVSPGEIRVGTWWYDEQELTPVVGTPRPAYGVGWVEIADELRLIVGQPEVLRALGQAFLAAADQLVQAYAEHGAEPPAPALDETRSTRSTA